MRTMKTCSVPNCDRKHYARGFCNTHYMRLRNGTDLDAPILRRRRTKTYNVPASGVPS